MALIRYEVMLYGTFNLFPLYSHQIVKKNEESRFFFTNGTIQTAQNNKIKSFFFFFYLLFAPDYLS